MLMQKKFISLMIMFFAIVITFTGCGKQETSKEEDQIKIGAILPLTGDVSSFGESSKNALEMLVEKTNKEGGISSKKIKIIYEDDENKPEKSVSSLEKLVADEKVVAIIGSSTSKCSMAMGPMATKNKVPMITPTATNPKVTTEGGSYVYRACYTDTFQGSSLSEYILRDLKMNSAAIIYNAENDYSKGFAESFKSNFEKTGGKVVAYESYSDDEQDFSKQLAVVKKSNADVLLLPDYYNRVGLIAKQVKAEGIKSMLVGGDGWDSPDLFKVSKDSLNGGLFINHYSPGDTNPELVEFKKAYVEKYHKTPDACSILAYNSLKILLNSIEKVGSSDSSKIKDTIKESEVNLIFKNVEFNENGDLIRPAVIIKIENGKQTFIKKINP